eukprot:jgi/Mesen1/9541/ME000064S08887
MDAQNRAAIIIDNGTGYTKMGYAGNVEPCFIVPTVVALNEAYTSGSGAGGGGGGPTKGLSAAQIHSAGVMADLDFFIGNEANQAARAGAYTLSNPIKHGQVDNWDTMERFWQQCIFNYLRADPEDHYFLLTESPLTPPEHREYSAEIMFETFNVAGLYIAVQAVLALAAGYTATQAPLTGVVVDSGEGVTHVVPVSDGYVIGSSIRSIPIAGRDITAFIQQLMRRREQEYGKHDKDPRKYHKTWSAKSSKTGHPFTCDIGYEQFLAPEAVGGLVRCSHFLAGPFAVVRSGVREWELFDVIVVAASGAGAIIKCIVVAVVAVVTSAVVLFSPEIYSSDFTLSLPEVVDRCIQTSPIDTRRALYKNIVLSGGSTMFKDFGRRLQRDLKKIVDSRVAASAALASALSPSAQAQTRGVDVSVVSHHMQRFAVWFGGSVLASTPSFYTACHTKAEYEEYGPSICRTNPVFKGVV